MAETDTIPNPDLAVGAGSMPGWNQPGNRRAAFHGLQRVARYVKSFRAPRVWPLKLDMSWDIARREDVRFLTALSSFSAMVVVRDDTVLFERYAPDFGAGTAHSIMSISKTTTNLILGRLIASGRIDLSHRVDRYLPWIGPGYAAASIQQVMNMDVANDYSEDYDDPDSRCFEHEGSTGFRLMPDGSEGTMKSFIAGIGLEPGAADCRNRSGRAQYKSANTDVLALVAEAVLGRPLDEDLIAITEAAGIEGSLHVCTDRTGFPCLDGGIALTARDLARYAMIFARGGIGVDGNPVGDASFLEATRAGGVAMGAPRDWLRYSNQTNTDGTWLGHGGFGGQYMLVNPETRTACVFFSVLESRSGYDQSYYVPVIRMCEAIARQG